MTIPSKISLANIPTPIQKFTFNSSTFYMKRDDFTGVELSGNKVRKLEFLLYEAQRKKTNYIFTCGGEQSNHARATVLAAASIGLKSKLFLWGRERKNLDGNLFLSKMVKPEIQYLNKKEYFHVDEIMAEDKKRFESSGKKVYVIPEGGSSPLGIWGYISFIKELKEQLDPKKFTGILVAAGSGGTAAGLLIGCKLNGLGIKIFAVNVLYNKETIENKIFSCIEACIDKFKLKIRVDRNALEIMDGYSTEGYKNITPAKLRVIKKFAASNGILFDPAYTGKAFYAYNDNFLKKNSACKILFVHTGGLYGAFSKRVEYLKT